ncbi:MAG: SLOG cluster 4 domain-containing protein [Leptospirales bacterium]
MTQDPVCHTPIPQLGSAAAIRIHEGRIHYFDKMGCAETFDRNPAAYAQDSGRKFTVGVMGSASGELSSHQRFLVFRLGQALARQKLGLITGACPGLPYEATLGFKSIGGLSIGISPALSEQEHLDRYNSPNDLFDMIIFTGSGLMGREVINIRSSDVVIIAGGHSGTLGEFSIAYDEGKLIGVLEGTGGITEILPSIVENIRKTTGTRLVYHTDPEQLVNILLETYTHSHFQKPSVFVG